MQTQKKERADKRYIRLLTALESATEPMNTGPSLSNDLMFLEELRVEGFIFGVPRRDEHGAMAEILKMVITLKGRLFLDDIRKKESLNTSWGILVSIRWRVYGFLLSSIIGGLIGAALVLCFR